AGPTRFLTELAAATPVVAGIDGRWSTSTTPSSRSTGTANKDRATATPEVRGLNALLATVTTAQAAPVIVAQRLRKGSCGSPRGAARIVADALATVRPTGHARVDRTSPGACRLRVLRASHSVGGDPRRSRRVGHRPTRSSRQSCH